MSPACYFHVKMNISADFCVCISVPLTQMCAPNMITLMITIRFSKKLCQLLRTGFSEWICYEIENYVGRTCYDADLCKKLTVLP